MAFCVEIFQMLLLRDVDPGRNIRDFFMRRPALGSLPLKRHAGRAAGSGRKLPYQIAQETGWHRGFAIVPGTALLYRGFFMRRGT